MQNVLYTRYAKDMDGSCPHAYYPRPSMRREGYTILNGEWDLAISASETVEQFDLKIIVPFCPESALSGISRHPTREEYLHYRRKFDLPERRPDGRVLLHFGAVDQECTVYVNGNKAGENRGGYLPFTLDVTELVKDRDNELYVRARDTLDKKYPYGKQTEKRGGMWYTPVSGIWQTVWLECVPKNAIESIRVTPYNEGVTVEVRGGAEKKRLTLTESGRVIEFYGSEVLIEPEEKRTWTPEDPYLYRFTLESDDDTVESYFAIRTVDVRDIDGEERICLNGEPYVFNGLLDQGYYSDGLFMPATIDGYIDDIRLAKELGFNMLRKHIKIEPEIFYYLCDEMGIAVFQDMVNNGGYSFIRDTALPTAGIQRIPDGALNSRRDTREIFTRTMLATAEHLYNHPSIVYYTIFNEGWGQFRADDAYVTLKRCDPTRIIDSTSGWFRRKKSDVDSRHIYFKRLKVGKRERGPLVISEFGGYSYRVPGHLFSEKNYGYRLYDSRESFEDGFIKLFEDEVLPLAEAGASAFVYTQLSDVEDETNGLVTYDREVVKVDAERCRATMQKLYKRDK